MRLNDITLLGWLHTLACLIAIAAGAYVLIAPKGTTRHRLLGWWYAGAMTVQSLLVMAIYRFDFMPGSRAKPGPHIFGFFHWGSVIALATVAIAVFAARRQRHGIVWAQAHAQAMLLSYYLLGSALINELFARVAVLRALALPPHAATTLNSPLVRQAQLTLLLLWVACAVWFALKVYDRRKPPAFTIGYPPRYAGGVFVACVGFGIMAGALLRPGALGWGLLFGFLAGITLARRATPRVRRIWGAPSLAQGRAMTLAVTLEFAVFMVLGSSGVFASVGRTAAWEISLAIVAAHFLIMRWSHGRIMLALGLSILGWLGIGVAAQLPVAMIAIGDGLLKAGFGLAMARPLLLSVRAVAGADAGVTPRPPPMRVSQR
jgi:uncharacterized membrane protein